MYFNYFNNNDNDTMLHTVPRTMIIATMTPMITTAMTMTMMMTPTRPLLVKKTMASILT